jgi:ureidoacrylate peracid hydrolase
VLVIDVQNDYCHEDGVAAHAGKNITFLQQVAPRILGFLEQIRKFGIPIVHIHNEHSDWTISPSWRKRHSPNPEPNTPCQVGSWGAEFYKVIPEDSEYIIAKHRYSAFINTDLDLVLRSIGIKTIILTGIETNVCVESTARHGFMKDYYVVLLEDCVAAKGTAEHEATLFNIRNYFGAVTSSQKLIQAWQDIKKIPSA